jgi:hypothetical protein
MGNDLTWPIDASTGNSPNSILTTATTTTILEEMCAEEARYDWNLQMDLDSAEFGNDTRVEDTLFVTLSACKLQPLPLSASPHWLMGDFPTPIGLQV